MSVLKRVPKFVWIGLVLVVILVFMVVVVKYLPAYASGDGLCTSVPEPFSRIEKRSGVITVSSESVYIVRAVISTGEGTTSEVASQLNFKPCWSNDPGLENVTNMYVTLDDGTFATIITGVIGRENAPPLE